MFRPIRHAWRVEVAHGLIGRYRRLAKSFENITSSPTAWPQISCALSCWGTWPHRWSAAGNRAWPKLRCQPVGSQPITERSI